VLATTLAVTLATGALFGLMPALQASRPDLGSALREGSRGTGGQHGQRVRKLLAAAQVALVVVLLTAAGLLIRSFQQLQQVQLGFRPDHLLTMQLSLPRTKYPTPAARLAFFESLLEKVQATPGVLNAGAITDIFLSQTPNSTSITIEGRTRTPDIANQEIPFDAVTPDYFKTMGIPVLRGRAFTATDGVGDSTAQQVVIINANMAKRFWPDEDAIGKRFKYGGDANGAGGGPWMTIVGVVGDMRRTGYDAPIRYESFLPYPEQPTTRMTLVVRTSGEPIAMASTVRAQLRALDPQQPVYQVSSMEQLLSGMIAQRRFSMALIGTFAALALVLGIVGVYGVTSYLVAQRTREVGLRLALGAQPKQVVLMVVRQGLATAAVGVAAGLLAALATTRAMATMLYGVSPTDIATLLGVTVTLALATLLANYLPARRAARVDPLVALRSE
jgi:putative ABC transport system permease protein